MTFPEVGMGLDIGLLLLRVVVGLTLAAHGAQKLFGWFGGRGLEGTAQGYERIGYRPGPLMALLAGVGEAGGGVLLALGLLTPLGAAAGIGVMLNAIVSAHLSKGFWNSKGGFEFPLTIATVFAAVAFAGPGRFSLDRAIGWQQTGWIWGAAAVGAGLLAGLAVLAVRDRSLRAQRAGGGDAGDGAAASPSA
jgi:putative oxidoreductase